MTIELEVAPGEPAPRTANRRHRAVVGITAAVVVGAAAVAVTLGSPPPPPEPQVAVDLDGPLGWVERLIDAPPRGALAADLSITSELTDRVTQLIRTDTYHPHLVAVDDQMHAEQDVKLIYADDVDDRRIVLLALRLPVAVWTSAPAYPEPLARRGRTRIVWLSGPRGASASWLATVFDRRPPLDLLVGSILPHPLLVATVGGAQWHGVGSLGCDPGVDCTMIALTPPGCTIATAPHSDLREFRDAPTGSLLVRTTANYQIERWRVTCDGVVREDRFAPPMWRPGPASAEEVGPALADAAGPTADERASSDVRTQAQLLVSSLRWWTGLPLTGPARVLWAGPATDWAAPDTTARAMVAVAPVPGDTWIAGYSLVTSDPTDPDSGLVEVFQLGDDPTAVGRMLVVPSSSGTGSNRLLAIPPAAAAAVRFVDPGTGAISEEPVVGGVAAVSPAGGAGLFRLTPGQVVAVDAAGNPVAANVAAGPFVSDFTADWT